MGCNCNKNKLLSTEHKLPEETPPQVDRKRYGLTDVIKDTITGKAEYVSDEVYKSRLDVCKKCRFLIKLPLHVNGTGNCGKCGCFVDFKAKYAKSKCDVFKW
jgi:hypothetical protein